MLPPQIINLNPTRAGSSVNDQGSSLLLPVAIPQLPKATFPGYPWESLGNILWGGAADVDIASLAQPSSMIQSFHAK